jgi:lysophospholipase L1-like esterase
MGATRWACGVVMGMLLVLPARGEEKGDYWVAPMKKVHARFTGTKGTFAQFGDSITVTMAFWAPLAGEPKKMSKEMAKAHALVKKYQKAECWNRWKGEQYGNTGSMTIRWADENVEKWLKKLNPEVAVILFGTNDLGQLELKEFTQKTRDVVRRCLKNGTVVLLTTLPPRSGQDRKAKAFAEAVRKIGREEKVPVVDYQEAVLKRRPKDWDGSLAKFRKEPGGEYDVPTLVCRDGVHPSNPKEYQDYSEESLTHNGYALRNHLTLMAYAGVIEKVLKRAK